MLGPAATAEQRAAQRTALGLDRPLPAQFGTWLSRFARGDRPRAGRCAGSWAPRGATPRGWSRCR
jgi:hypothetical protein